jgi:hypothetical protein
MRRCGYNCEALKPSVSGENARNGIKSIKPCSRRTGTYLLVVSIANICGDKTNIKTDYVQEIQSPYLEPLVLYDITVRVKHIIAACHELVPEHIKLELRTVQQDLWESFHSMGVSEQLENKIFQPGGVTPQNNELSRVVGFHPLTHHAARNSEDLGLHPFGNQFSSPLLGQLKPFQQDRVGTRPLAAEFFVEAKTSHGDLTLHQQQPPTSYVTDLACHDSSHDARKAFTTPDWQLPSTEENVGSGRSADFILGSPMRVGIGQTDLGASNVMPLPMHCFDPVAHDQTYLQPSTQADVETHPFSSLPSHGTEMGHDADNVWNRILGFEISDVNVIVPG